MYIYIKYLDCTFFQAINPVNHWKILIKTKILFFYLIVYMFQYYDFPITLPNPFQFILLYCGSYCMAIIFEIAIFIMFLPFYIIIKIVKIVIPENDNKFPSISSLIIMFGVFTYQIIDIFGSESLIHEFKLEYYLMFIIPFICLLQFIIQMVIIVLLIFESFKIHYIFYLTATAKIGIMAQQLGYYYDLKRFFTSPPGTYTYSDIPKYLQTFILDYCITTFYYLNWKYKFLLSFKQKDKFDNNDKIQSSKQFKYIRKYIISISIITLYSLLFTLMNYNCYVLYLNLYLGCSYIINMDVINIIIFYTSTCSNIFTKKIFRLYNTIISLLF